MNSREWASQAVPIAAILPEFQPIQFGFARVNEWTAECLYADTSSVSRRAFYLQAFVLPLFVPTQHIYFDYGFRIGDRHELVNSRLVSQVAALLPRLSQLATFDGLYAAAANPFDVRHVEVRLCCGILAGSSGWIEDNGARLERWAMGAPWEGEVLQRSRALFARAKADGINAAVADLRRRRDGVIKLLRVRGKQPLA